MTKAIDVNSFYQELLDLGLSDKEARKQLKADAKKLFKGDSSLFEKYQADDASSAMRIGNQILAWLENDTLALAETDFTDVDVETLSDTNEDGFVYTAKEKKESYEKIFREKRFNKKKRVALDIVKNVLTYICSAISLVVLILIIYYCFATGGSTLNWEFITGNDASTLITAQTGNLENDHSTVYKEPSDLDEDAFFSQYWGVAFLDDTNPDGSHDLVITYVDPNSPIYHLSTKEGEEINLTFQYSVKNIGGADASGELIAFSQDKDAESAAAELDEITILMQFIVQSGGFGIRGPLIATLWMILFSLLFSLPLGIGAAIYLAYYAKKNQITSIIRSMIDMISGIPSIIFGLAGAVIFIPIFSGGSGIGTILSGAATLACMVLPTIIKNTEEAINVIPKSLKNASLALGASQTQTVFKVILPNSVPGILTGGLLAVGRIVGESAALVFATGATIVDSVGPNQSSAATLAVYIWKAVTGKENPNYKAAAATAILILIVVLILNITVKLIANKLDKFKPKKKGNWFTKTYNKIKNQIIAHKEARKAILASANITVEETHEGEEKHE